MCRLPRHHATVLPHHQYPRRRLGGWRGPVLPLAPPGWRGIVVGDLHHSRLIDRGGDGLWQNCRCAVAAAVTTAVVVASCCDPVATAVPRGGHLSPPRSLPPAAPSTSAAWLARTHPT
jgi:hypothetical protein